MDASIEPFPDTTVQPLVSFSRSLPDRELAAEYGGEWVLVRDLGDRFEVVAHDAELENTLASADRRERDISMYVLAEHELRI
jgi:hypothetical protein